MSPESCEGTPLSAPGSSTAFFSLHRRRRTLAMSPESCEGKPLSIPTSFCTLGSSAVNACAIDLTSELKVKYLPLEIISHILIRLPIKSLIKCTAVCKSWRDLMRSPRFTQMHHRHTVTVNNDNDTRLLLVHSVSSKRFCSLYERNLIRQERDDLYTLYYDNRGFEEYSKIELPSDLKEIVLGSSFRVAGTCNGLVCLVDNLNVRSHGYSFIIWNPCIRKFVTLPEPAFGTRSSHEAASAGFGYDAINNDYKVVRLVTDSDQNQDFKDWPSLFQVYSLATGSWSRLRSVVPPCQVIGFSAQAFLNGALHWSAMRRTDDAFDYFVLVFEVASELFREIMFPNSFKWDPSLALRISVSGNGETIVLFSDWQNSGTDYFLDIWMMRDYCIEKTWAKLIIFRQESPQRSLPKPLCFRRSGEVLVLEDTRELVSLDLVTGESKILGVYGGQYCSVDAYEESLFLLVMNYGASL